LLEYLSNPANPTLDRCDLATQVIGYKSKHTIYKQFTPDELTEIEWEALALRRKRYAPKMLRVDRGLLKKAEEGTAAEAKLAYQKFEGWSEKQNIEVGLNMEVLNIIFAVLPADYVTAVKDALRAVTSSSSSKPVSQLKP